MKVLVIGGGGREHAIVWKIAQSEKVDKIYCAPGNAGIEEYAECVDIGVMEFDRLTDFAEREGVDLTVVGPDDPLAAGIVDAFEAKGLRVFGPRAAAAQIEASKAFSKDLMEKYHIPTAAHKTFDKAVIEPEPTAKAVATATMTYEDAQLQEKIAKARIAELELQEKEGALVSRERINAQLFAAGKELRDTLLAIPDRITDVVMAEDNRAIVHNTIYDAIADALQKLADFQTRIDQ